MSAAAAAAAASAVISYRNSSENEQRHEFFPFAQPRMMQVFPVALPRFSRYEIEKRRDWNTFCAYLRIRHPSLTLSRCGGEHVVEFLRYMDQFGETKVHSETCEYFGDSYPPGPCPCPLKQAWDALDGIVGRLRAAFEGNGGDSAEMNPFEARAVMVYIMEVRNTQARARGIAV